MTTIALLFGIAIGWLLHLDRVQRRERRARVERAHRLLERMLADLEWEPLPTHADHDRADEARWN